MANQSRRTELTTKDDVPLRDILGYAVELLDQYNDAPKSFLNNFTQEVSSRTFMQRTGDMTWQEVAEMEHAKTGTLSSEQMAFSVKTYNRSLGYSREFLEDNPSEIVREELTELIKGARKKEFEILFDVLKTGVADGSELWFTPQDYGAYSFTKTHDHTFADTNELFGDTNSYEVSTHIREANKELRHHGKSPAVVLMSSDMAAELVSERTDGTNHNIPQAESLLEGALPDLTLIEDGARAVQTAWLSGNEMFVMANETPIKRNTVRPAELTDNTGAPIGGAGGSYGDPAALLGAYGSMRLGAKFADPLAGVKFNATSIA
ncbi:hypothetical protein ACFQL7_20885 [Halocatena marina]|uniref:Major capsid protein n=1 Tax=Halocatena marina TaxID=2934937 RepID=A0ABD5YVT6_9EURY|nr:hypothetical protein [Halocatena marina]